jgi:hypothetical protein
VSPIIPNLQLSPCAVLSTSAIGVNYRSAEKIIYVCISD